MLFIRCCIDRTGDMCALIGTRLPLINTVLTAAKVLFANHQLNWLPQLPRRVASREYLSQTYNWDRAPCRARSTAADKEAAAQAQAAAGGGCAQGAGGSGGKSYPSGSSDPGEGCAGQPQQQLRMAAVHGLPHQRGGDSCRASHGGACAERDPLQVGGWGAL